jgi:hypothetical protein
MEDIDAEGVITPFARNIYVLDFHFNAWQWQATNQEVKTEMQLPTTDLNMAVLGIVRDIMNLREKTEVLERLRTMKSSLINSFFPGE